MRKSLDEMLADLRSTVREIFDSGEPKGDPLYEAYKEEYDYLEKHLHEVALRAAQDRLEWEAEWREDEIDSKINKILELRGIVFRYEDCACNDNEYWREYRIERERMTNENAGLQVNSSEGKSPIRKSDEREPER